MLEDPSTLHKDDANPVAAYFSALLSEVCGCEWEKETVEALKTNSSDRAEPPLAGR
jgi:hypothetical protein